jgi:hypothetical protein
VHTYHPGDRPHRLNARTRHDEGGYYILCGEPVSVAAHSSSKACTKA